jgi:hypothetical protein
MRRAGLCPPVLLERSSRRQRASVPGNSLCWRLAMRPWQYAAITSLIVSAACLLWLATVERGLSINRDRMRRLQAVSVGMYRDDVVGVLGEPHKVIRESELLRGRGEILAYASSWENPDDMWVICNRHGRVVSIYYPDVHSAAGGAPGGIVVPNQSASPLSAGVPTPATSNGPTTIIDREEAVDGQSQR